MTLTSRFHHATDGNDRAQANASRGGARRRSPGDVVLPNGTGTDRLVDGERVVDIIRGGASPGG
jgi:hypothetical protein